MNKMILFCSLLTMSFSAMSEPQYWMKKDNPNSLGLFVMVSDKCPFKQSNLMKLAEGEFLRARIKPTDDMNDLNITIAAVCVKQTNTYGQHMGYGMSYSIDFSIRMVVPVPAYVNYAPNTFGILTNGSSKGKAKTEFLASLREDISSALTDYLKANME